VAEVDDLLATIEAAHAAALDETLWPDALNALAGLFGAAGATLEEFGKQPLGLRYFRIAGLPPGSETPISSTISGRIRARPTPSRSATSTSRSCATIC
jgi:hypothetical protein